MQSKTPPGKPIILEQWSLDAMRELVDITAMLNDGLFVSPSDLGDRLLRCAESLILASGEPLVIGEED
jgi:hypothetical protein